MFKAEKCAAGLEANESQLVEDWHFGILLKNLQKRLFGRGR